MPKTRLDIELLTRNLAPSRERARALIMEGVVYVDGQKVTKAGEGIAPDVVIEVRAPGLPYVSRGGLKLEKALREFSIDLSRRVCADIGASTGGFTDCMLQNGAATIYAIDVGYGQLDYRLRTDARVQVMERTNARYMEPAWFASALDFASIDVSFISLRLMLPPLYACLREGGEAVALIKPQFEAGRSEVGKNGVVRDAAVHESVCIEILNFAYSIGYAVRGLSFSPIKGPKGNMEFLAHLCKPCVKNVPTAPDLGILSKNTVHSAHIFHNS
ncbi:MAG: TlyA family RNA methyltransferase [Clostridiales bacterium]|nr:TlyA family RNA methyltransferase [Clostridiales bacterium]